MEKLNNQIVPYEGNEDYIFISYSHRDSQEVYPILRELQAAGYRLWYDDGIDPGTEWPESIGAHLNGCSVCLAFMSPDSLASNNCRREINFALSKNKKFLSVILRPVEMTPGMEMQISTYQSILKYKYPRREAFLQRLYAAEALEGCQVPAPEPEPEPGQREKEPGREPAAPPEKPKKAAAPKKISRERTGKKASGKKSPVKGILIGTGAFLAVLLFLLIGMATGLFRAKVVINGVEYVNDTGSQVITDSPITVKDMKKLSSLKDCFNLELNGCQLESGALEQLSGMKKLGHLTLIDCTGVEDLTFIHSLPKVYWLTVQGCGVTDDFFGELEPSTGIRILDLGNNQLKKVPDLTAWTKLTELSLADNQISSAAGLENLEGLTKLYLNGNQLTDVEELESLIHITALSLADNQLKSIEPLRYFSELTKVDISGNPGLTGIEILSVCREKLVSLNISGVKTENLDFLSGSESLNRIYAVGCGLTDMKGIAGNTGLTVADFSENSLTDVSGFANMVKLQKLNLSQNAIQSMETFGDGMKDALSLCLDLRNNELLSLSGLPGVRYDALLLSGNPLEKLSAAEGLTGSTIALDCTEGLDLEELSGLNFLNYCMTSVPLEQQIELENALKSRLEIMDQEEVTTTYLKDAFFPRFE